MVRYVQKVPLGYELMPPGTFWYHQGQFFYNNQPPPTGHQFLNTTRSRFPLADAKFTRILSRIDFFIVVDFFFFAIFVAIFLVLSNRCPKMILCVKLALTFNIPFILYRTVFLLFQASVVWPRRNTIYIRLKSLTNFSGALHILHQYGSNISHLLAF